LEQPRKPRNIALINSENLFGATEKALKNLKRKPKRTFIATPRKNQETSALSKIIYIGFHQESALCSS